MTDAAPILIDFPGADEASRTLHGGKGAALVRGALAGLPVPAGSILTTRFFAPWIERLTRSSPWRALQTAEAEEHPRLGAELEALALDLPLEDRQRGTFDALTRRVEALGGRVAVRSSAPDEDLAAASFAGAHRTRLGVDAAGLETAVRDCFASAFAPRVVSYRQTSGFAPTPSAFAVIVQRQLDSQRAGVAFSIDPETNDFDHVVIEAAWGQGEAVVSGRVEPDHLVIDKPSGRIVDRRTGSKLIQLRLTADGSLVERPVETADTCCLDDDRARDIARLVAQVEALASAPVDIEWAEDDAGLHLLQSRPITRYVPLPPEMMTAPGARRRLYGDIALSSGLTINGPISPLGLDWMRRCIDSMVTTFVGGRRPRRGAQPPIADALWFTAGGRMYQNFSNLFVLVNPRRLARPSAGVDTLTAATLESLDGARYRAERRPPSLGWSLVRRLPATLVRLRAPLVRSVAAMLRPARAARRLERDLAAHRQELDALAERRPSLETIAAEHLDRHLRRVVDATMPALGAGLSAVALLQSLARRRGLPPSEVEALGLGFIGNVVAEMGIALFRLARSLRHLETRPDDPTAGAEQAGNNRVASTAALLLTRQAPADVLAAWDDVLASYGWRGPSEMDLASPRFADRPEDLVEQVLAMPIDTPALDPQNAHERRVAERRRATELLRARCGPFGRRLVDHLTQVVEHFAGHRDTPKHANLRYFQLVRHRLVERGEMLVAAGRLDDAGEVFDLTFSDLGAADRDPAFDLRAVRHERTAFHRVLQRTVRTFPVLIDSRGRILRPPRGGERAGELQGTPISSGRARGRVRLLDQPDAGPFAAGDILVAYATDPGWTPLLARAGAVVLEIGGALQHGAVVAREYGKPCVAGIDRLLERLDDGCFVEVDGDRGIVRRLDEGSAPTSDVPG
ncbi:MAG: PEP/pyruvate-binding domain-containing protein [Acidobacteriota bacterium]